MSFVPSSFKHKTINNNTARQIFLDNAIFAFLPISNNKTSIVWSIKNSMKDIEYRYEHNDDPQFLTEDI